MARKVLKSYIRPGTTVLGTDLFMVQRGDTYLAFPVSSVVSGGGAVVPVAANTFYAGPSTGSPVVPTFRTITPADVPGLPASILTSGVLPTGRISSSTPAAGLFLDYSQTWSRPSPLDPTFVVISSGTTATAGAIHLVNTGAGSFSVVLPVPSPAADTVVWFGDQAGSVPGSPSGFGLYPLTLLPGAGQNIQGQSSLALATDNLTIGLALRGNRWTIINQSSVSGGGGGGGGTTTTGCCSPIAIDPSSTGVYTLMLDNNGNVIMQG